MPVRRRPRIYGPKGPPRGGKASRTVLIARVNQHDMRILVDEFQREPALTLMFDNKKFGISFTNLTMDELTVMETVFKVALDLARPIVQYLDDKYLHADADTENPLAFHRLYRTPPLYSLRQRVLTSQYSGVPGGPDIVADVVERYWDPGAVYVRRSGGHGREFLAGVPVDMETRDDAEEDRDDEGTGGPPGVAGST